MRIRSTKIERYAGLGGISLSDLSPGLNVLVGCNEAGKTSMMEFLRTTLAPSKSRGYPYAEGTIAGSMVLMTREGMEIAARRTGRSKVTLDPPDLLSPPDADVYATVFALGLEDLEALDLQDPAGVASKLMATSLGIPRLPEAMDILGDDMAGIYTARGRKQEMPMALADLRAVDAEIAREREALPEYLSLVDEVRTLVEHQDSLETEKADCRAGLDRMEVCIREAEGLLRRRELRARIGPLSPSSSLEPGTHHRYLELENALEGRMAERQALLDETSALEGAIGEDLPPTDDELMDWLSRLGHLRAEAERLPRLEAEASAMSQEMDRHLSELGADWTIDRLLSVDMSLPSLDSIRAIASDLRDTRAALTRRSAQRMEVGSSTPMVAKGGPGRVEPLSRLHVLLMRRRDRDPPWMVVAPVMAMALLGAAALATMHAPIPAAAVALAGTGASVAVHLFRSSRCRGQDLEIASLCHELGLRHDIGAGEVDRLRGDALIEEALTGGSAPAQRLHEMQRAQKEAAMERDIAHLEAEVGEKDALWTSALRASGLPAVRPEGLEHVISLLVECREMEGRREQAVRSLSHTRAMLDPLSDAMGPLRADGESPIETLERLAREEEGRREERVRIERVRGRLEVTMSTLDAVNADIDRIQAELDGMRSGLDRETFIERAMDREDLMTLERELRDIDVGLRARIPPGMDLEGIEIEVLGRGGSGLRDSRGSLQRRIEGIEAELSNHRRTMGAITERLRNMETSNNLEDLMQRRSVLTERLRDMAERWAVSALSAALLESVRSMYERDRQPALMVAASEMLECMTGGRHRLVLSASGGLVVDDGVERKSPAQWSRGLRDQAYLSLRLALIAEHGAAHEPLPVILDDVMARSDPERQRGMARCLSKTSESNQVLMLSCHPGIAAIMVDECPDAKFFEYRLGVWQRMDG